MEPLKSTGFFSHFNLPERAVNLTQRNHEFYLLVILTRSSMCQDRLEGEGHLRWNPAGGGPPPPRVGPLRHGHPQVGAHQVRPADRQGTLQHF